MFTELLSSLQKAHAQARAHDHRRLFLASALCFFWLLAFSLNAADAAKPDKAIVDERTERVIKAALKWLASKQLPNGAWGSSPDEQRHPTAITGYVLIAFQAAGQLPGEGEFGKSVTAGMQY